MRRQDIESLQLTMGSERPDETVRDGVNALVLSLTAPVREQFNTGVFESGSLRIID